MRLKKRWLRGREKAGRMTRKRANETEEEMVERKREMQVE